MKKTLLTITTSIAILLGISSGASAASNTYIVKKGDTLYKIATTNHVTVSELRQWNKLSSYAIKVNEVLNITNPSSTSTKVIKEITVSSSAYTLNCTHCSGITKTGINLKANPNQKVISVDPKIIKLGTKVYVPGYGYAIAGDTGAAVKGNRIDIFMPSLSAAKQWGRRTVSIQILE